jgi:hypothetical protein
MVMDVGSSSGVVILNMIVITFSWVAISTEITGVQDAAHPPDVRIPISMGSEPY